jgi:hypothetical protein
MFGIVSVAYVPVYAINLLMEAFMSSGGPQDLSALLASLIFLLLWVIVALPLSVGSATYAVSRLYLGEEVTIGEAYGRAWKRIGTLINTQFTIGIRVLLGFILLIVPGILWSLSYAIAIPVVMIEGQKTRVSMRRSWELVSGQRGKVFLVILVLQILAGVIQGAIAAIFAMTVGVETVMTSVAFSAVTYVIALFLIPLQTIAPILLYYDFRIRKEGFDLEMLSQAFAPVPEARPVLDSSN